MACIEQGKIKSCCEWYFWKYKNNKSSIQDCDINPNYVEEYADLGFHCCLTRRDAMKFVNDIGFTSNQRVLLKLRVREFIAIGTVDSCGANCNGMINETWKYADIIDIFDKDGKKITKKFFKNHRNKVK